MRPPSKGYGGRRVSVNERARANFQRSSTSVPTIGGSLDLDEEQEQIESESEGESETIFAKLLWLKSTSE